MQSYVTIDPGGSRSRPAFASATEGSSAARCVAGSSDESAAKIRSASTLVNEPGAAVVEVALAVRGAEVFEHPMVVSVDIATPNKTTTVVGRDCHIRPDFRTRTSMALPACSLLTWATPWGPDLSHRC